MVKDTIIEKATIKNKVSKPKEYVFAVGRRKEAVARVRLYSDNGDNLTWGEHSISKGAIFVNGLPVESYFSGGVAKACYTEPLRATNTLGKLTATIKVEGGGNKSQLDAAILGIARALDLLDKDKNHSILRKKGFLTRDARTRERRKVGMGGKARRKRQSPKR